MKKNIQLRVLPSIASQEKLLQQYCAKELKIDARSIYAIQIIKKSIDARHRIVYVNLTLDIYVNEHPQPEEQIAIRYPDVVEAPNVIVVGAGPGGFFAALRLIELGLRPIVLERGKSVKERKKDIALIPKEHLINPESNYSFGEGGAGAFSDGKLYTRSKKRGSVEKILKVFCQHGASRSILHDAHPHIGTDKLPLIIERIREQIIQSGGEVRFSTRVDGFLLEKGKIEGVITQNKQTFRGPVILATGHSARDMYRYLHEQHISLEAKTIAVGVRLEHSSHAIDCMQYHNKNGRGKFLPAAEYSFVTQVKERGVYSFCMCPGGFVVPAATGNEEVVVNGMSPSNRGSAWSNAGMVVETRPEDLEGELKPFMEEIMRDDAFAAKHQDYSESQNPLRLMYFQEAIEKCCWLQGNRSQTAPAQRMLDFTQRRLSYDLPKSSYSPGLISSPLHFWLPSFIVSRLTEAFKIFGKKSPGFLTNDAILIAAETRTSSPVRIIRDKDTLEHPEVKGLFPCGEGAGYAGGIVSAAIDGERCAEAAANYLKKENEAENLFIR